ncbi:MAG: hypothetical protein JFR38_09180 [Muribaculaceae bacterium]|nr:hypothetical protein [Muribaculaceae bacterium]
MATISTGDILFASASQHGRNIATIRLSGQCSTGGVIAELRRIAGHTLGLVQVTLRNATQGWSRVLTLYLAPQPASEGVQLSLF